ncbi:fucose-binding protein [Rhizobium sp. Leaf371]|uniref:RbsD/FucU family protein n=1 Tax=Rhizobium sp. Leaf371 TaxID=1736355 RepID=UPI0007160C65|nr:RbsD/FucU domain-containing protein [Rhizobium sp. Leaf371]KQS64196.1 fucose-binding protein [Rhizobium sp. Leaf371]
MLKGIDPVIHADLMHAMMRMGHGDDLVLCDINHPAATIAAHTTYGRLLDLSGCGLTEAARAILTLFPLDTFVERPVSRMQVVGDPEARMPIFDAMQDVVDASQGRAIPMEALERFAFYEAAKRSFVIVRTSDPGPYGCFIFKKGVI